MFGVVALLWCFHGVPAWAAAGGGLHPARRVRDLDPGGCLSRCLQGGFQVAGLSSAGCYCGRRLSALKVTERFDTSSHGGSKDVRGARKGQSVVNLPAGRGWNVAIYRTEGPFLQSVRLAPSSDRVHAGKAFVLEVCGELAGNPNLPTAIAALEGQNLSSVTVEILCTSSAGQSSRCVDVPADGSFTLTSDWIVETKGIFIFMVRAPNPLSKPSSTLRLVVLHPPPQTLLTSFPRGPPGVPSCIPVVTASPRGGSAKDDRVALQAYVAHRPAPELTHWWLKRRGSKEGGKERTGVGMLCLSSSEGPNSALVWRGLHSVSVKASGWTHKTVYVVVAPPAVLESARPHGRRASVGARRKRGVAAWPGATPRLSASGTSSGSNFSAGAREEEEAVSFLHRAEALVVEGPAENPPSSPRGEGKRGTPPRPARRFLESGGRAAERAEQAGKMTARVHAASRAYPTNADVTFLAVTDVPDPAEFLWHFGDATSARTASGTATRRYRTPGSYDVVVVVVSAGGTSVASPPLPLRVQRAVRLNRLVHRASVLRNQTATVSCRVDAGTDVDFLWSFGDGTVRAGRSSEQHVFRRVGEFQVVLTASNLVSSASLSSRVFVVDRPCQPPPVKNMGPHTLRVRRHEAVRLGVTYDADVDCDVSGGLGYTWTLSDSAGGRVPLSGVADPRRQSLTLPAHFLQYDTYTATARVQVVGSVVHSNYSVRVQVVPGSPVASIRGGTNFFINRSNVTTVTLDGRSSHDPDFPSDPVSFRWTCEPVSSVPSSCFERDVAVSSPELTFPLSVLKSSFDQFRFGLTVKSGEGPASTEAFVTIATGVISKVMLRCPRCQGDQVIWDQPLSVGASCEECAVPSRRVSYSWSLYLVDASSKPSAEVPFCHTVDLSSPSSIVGGPRPRVRTSTPSLEDDYEGDRDTNGEELFRRPRGGLDAARPRRPPRALENDFDPDSSSADGELSLPRDAGHRPDYDVPFPIMEEGDPGPSAGRPTGGDSETPGSGGDSEAHPALPDDEGSNLVGSGPPAAAVVRKPTLLDLPREPVETGLFESYTYSGIFSSQVELRPFSLKPGSRYMLEATAKFRSRLLGRTQLFLRTKPAPTGMTCQVQPVKGAELHTHFSIFCTSGREDLVYEYSYSVGNEPPRVLYEGNDFQYYFSLPSGRSNDDYKVTIYTKIRSSMRGTSTKLCAVTVQVLPSFRRDASSPDPDVELSNFVLKNLSSLARLGNDAEVRNHVSLLSGVLSRLGADAGGDAGAQTRARSALICTVCQLESREQAALIDRINILKELLGTTNQVTLASVRRVVAHVRLVSERLSAPGAALGYRLDGETLDGLVAVLACGLRAADLATTRKPEPPERIRNGALSGCGYDSPDDVVTETSVSARQVVADVLQTASQLLLRYTLLLGAPQHGASSGPLSLHAACLSRTAAVVGGSSATFHVPASLVRRVFVTRGGGEEECVMGLVTEFARSSPNPQRASRPVVQLSLYQCSTRRKIPVPYLLRPVIAELHQPPTIQRGSHSYSLHRSRVNYHSFNVTHEHLQRAIQLSVEFTRPPGRTFPVLLLFRMFERPTPSMHHLQRVHRWGSSAARISLPPSYLNGVGHLALLDADFGKPLRRRHLSIRVDYSLTVRSSRCVSWDDQQGAWTYLGCGTQQGDAAPTVNCSCLHLRPLTVEQQQIESSHASENVDQFVSTPSNLTVLAVLAAFACLSVPALAACRRADAALAGESRGACDLADNSPGDAHRYAVTLHTGLRSAAGMSAKVYIVLHGDDGVSQTRELHVPGCNLFRRNSRDTFILSAADSLGHIWGVHIWHDNSGPSPDWHLKLVEVSELSRAHARGRTWLFVAQCWLSVSRGDGQVERTLRACAGGIGFAKLLQLKLLDYLADFHTWMSVCCCPRPLTHTQRLGVCALLLSAYACLNAAAVSQMDEPLPFEMGIVAPTAVSVTTGALSALAGLPAACLISLLFRLREARLMRSGSRRSRAEDALTFNDSASDARLSWSNLQQRAPEAQKKKQSTSQLSESTREDSDKAVNQIQVVPSKEDEGAERNGPDRGSWGGRGVGGPCPCPAWALCLLPSLVCLLLAALLGLRFSSGKALLWMHSLFCSLVTCMFLIQPAVILAAAVIVSLWYRNTADFHSFTHKLDSGGRPHSAPLRPRPSNLERLLGARRRARYLRLVRPPAPAELRLARGRRRRETSAREALRDLSVCVAMLLLMLCVRGGGGFSGDPHHHHRHLCKAVKQHFTRGRDPTFMSIRRHEDWWRWTHTLLEQLYRNESDGAERSHILIGEPVLLKTEISSSFHHQVSAVSLSYSGAASTYPRSDVTVPMATPQRSQGYSRRHSAATAVGLGHTRSDAALKLRLLRSDGWLGGGTSALQVQFTLFSPSPNLFAAVSLRVERSPGGALRPSATVRSARVYHSATVWDYVAMVCQLLFLLLSLLHLCLQIHTVVQQGIMGYLIHSWSEVVLPTLTLVYYFHYVRHSSAVAEVTERLQERDYRGHEDISRLAEREQSVHTTASQKHFKMTHMRTLRGAVLFLLAVRCAGVLRGSAASAPPARSPSGLLLPMISSLILLAAFGSLRTLDLGVDFLHRGVGCLPRTAVWTALMIGIGSSGVRKAGRSWSGALAELTGYLRRRVCGRRKSARAPEQQRTYHLEEFDSLMDELLFKLNALSDSLHHTLPAKSQYSHHHHQQGEDSPSVTSLLQDAHTQSCEDSLKLHTDDETPTSPSFRPPEQRGRRKDASFFDPAVSADFPVQSAAKDGGNGNECVAEHPWVGQSASRSAADEAQEVQSGLLGKCDRCGEEDPAAAALTSEVLVEVLIHEEPRSAGHT